MKLENETAMLALLECAKHKFSMLALPTKNCSVFFSWASSSGTTCFQFYKQNLLPKNPCCPCYLILVV